MWRRSRTARCRPRAAARMRSRPVSSALYRAASGKPRWRSTRCAALSQQRMRRRDECVKHLNPELSTVLAPCHSLRLHSVHLFVSWTLCFPALPPSSRWRDQPFTVMRPSWAAWRPTGASTSTDLEITHWIWSGKCCPCSSRLFLSEISHVRQKTSDLVGIPADPPVDMGAYRSNRKSCLRGSVLRGNRN